MKELHVILACDEDHEKVFPEVPIIGFKSNKNLNIVNYAVTWKMQVLLKVNIEMKFIKQRKTLTVVLEWWYILIQGRPTCSWSFAQSFFMQKPQCGMRWLFDYFLRFFESFLCYFFQKQASKDQLNTRKLFKNNFIKWKTKQSWKGNVRKHLFILPIFFAWGRK